MFNLIKFETLKWKKFFTILGASYLVMQLYIIYNILRIQGVESTEIARYHLMRDIMEEPAIFMFITFVAFGVTALTSLFKDINSKDRSIVFMTPNSGFKIVSSKILTVAILGVGLVFAGVLWVAINSYFTSNGDFVIFVDGKEGVDLIASIIKYMAIVVLVVANFFTLVLLSIIVTKSFLSKVKFKTLTVVIVMAIIIKLFHSIFGRNINEISRADLGMSIISLLLITTAMLWVAGWLIDNKMDV